LAATAIFDPVQRDLDLVEEAIRQVGQVDYPLLASLLQYILSARGKRVRPAIVLLAASFHEYRLDLLVPLAAAIELLHTATLVHDDLVDNAAIRRGIPTLNTIAGHSVTVLVGDYLFANAARLCTETQNIRVMRVFGETLMTICDGELRQVVSAGQWRQTRQEYFDKIERKTASLLRTAAATGAILSGAPEDHIEALSQYGRHLGMAFQIVDDVLDFIGDEATLGKPVGSDLRQGTLTLPAIRLLEEQPDHPAMRRIFEEGDSSDRAIGDAVLAVVQSDGIAVAMEEARRLSRLAVASLAPLPASPSRQALETLADYVVTRAS
jgi:geranylgeranyl pyrophosphate synthase